MLTWTGTPKETRWPDLSRDHRAQEQARQQLGPNADVHELLALAQRLKDSTL